MLLRSHPQRPNAYTVVGPTYVRGLEDSAALLGPLPSPWIFQFRYECSTLRMHSYFTTVTGQSQSEDPHLLPFAGEKDWIRIPLDRQPDDPDICERLLHAVTGEVRKSDPRLDPDALRHRGVELVELNLV